MTGCSAPEINSRGSAGTNLQMDFLPCGHVVTASLPTAQGPHRLTSLLKFLWMFSHSWKKRRLQKMCIGKEGLLKENISREFQ